MATYGEIVTEIGLVVPRVDLDTLIRTKVNQIIRLISCSGKFWRDIEETTIGSADGVDAASTIQNIPVTTLVRSLLYVHYPSSVEDPDPIKCLTIEELTGRERCTKLGDVAYLSGSSLHIRNATLVSQFDIAYYTSPVFFATDGSEDNNSNWITEKVPGLVVDMTAAYILNLQGDNEDSRRVGELAAMMQSTYVRDFVESIE